MASLNDYVFAMPPGWTGTQYSDGLVLMSPAYATNERCVVTLWPMRQPGANVMTDAANAFRDVYKAYQLTNMTVRGSQMPSSIVHGVSGQGWEYAMIRRGIAPPGSRESRLGFVFVAKLNNRLAVPTSSPSLPTAAMEALPRPNSTTGSTAAKSFRQHRRISATEPTL